MSNPFVYGTIVKDENFCNRVNEVKELSNDILNKQNVLIYAPRRFGKTSLILKTIKNLDVKYIYIDLMTITTKQEFIDKLFNSIITSLQTPLDKTFNIIKKVFRIKPKLTTTINDMGNFSFSLSFLSEDTNTILEDVFNIPIKYQDDNNIVIIFDEFQEIENLEIENKLRSIIQTQTQISYVFLGSKKSIIQAMFSDNKRPFYKSVKKLNLNPILLDDWKNCIITSFQKSNKSIDIEYIENIINITKGFPYYTQQFCYELWELTDKQVDDDVFNQALFNLLAKEKEYFISIWDNLTLNQKKSLKVILETKGINVYDDKILSKIEIKKSSLQTTLKTLIQKDILDKKESYYFQDPLFEFWLLRE